MSQIYAFKKMFAVKHAGLSGSARPARAAVGVLLGLVFGGALATCEPAALERTCNAGDPWSCGPGFFCGQTPYGTRCVPRSCGDGVQAAPEECDGVDSVSCASFIGGAGRFTCGDDCRWDYSGCSRCGNHVLNGLEDCDGARFADGFSCQALGYTGGRLECLPSCRITTRSCIP